MSHVVLQQKVDQYQQIENEIKKFEKYLKNINNINNINASYEHIEGFTHAVFARLSNHELCTPLLVCKKFFLIARSALSTRIPQIVKDRKEVTKNRELAEKRLNDSLWEPGMPGAPLSFEAYTAFRLNRF